MSKQNNELYELLSALSEEMSAEELLYAHYTSDIAVAIASKRTTLGLSQAEFAQKIGKSQTTISKWENADCNFTLKTLIEIAQQLDLTLKISLDPIMKTQRTTQSNIILFPSGYKGGSSSDIVWEGANSADNELIEM